MAEQYKDTYRNQYREETEQIHAPLSLIQKTKAAVREEEKRLVAAASGREAKAAATLVTRENQEGVSAHKTEDADRVKQNRTFSIRKWAYPLSAAAAILILASVSLTMRGLKSADQMTASDTTYSGAADNGAAFAESATESAAAGGFYEEAAAEAPAEAPAAEESFLMDEEILEEDAAADIAEGAAAADAGQTDGLSRGDAVADMTASAKTAVENTECELMEEKADPEGKEEAFTKKQEASEQKGKDADSEDYTMQKVTKRPVRFSGADVKIRRYEGKTFRVLEVVSTENQTDKSWEAYVETGEGEGYVICGEAQSVEEFLAAANKKLEEEEK